MKQGANPELKTHLAPNRNKKKNWSIIPEGFSSSCQPSSFCCNQNLALDNNNQPEHPGH
jgi:hypothetical protein